MRSARLPGHLDLLLLAVMSEGPRHGYAVIAGLRERSDGVFDLPEGTVYPALHRLERAGLLASSTTRVEGRRRRVYRITPAGRSELEGERHEWRRFAGGVRQVIGGTA